MPNPAKPTQGTDATVGVVVGAIAATVAARNQNAYALTLEACGGALGGVLEANTAPPLRDALSTLGALGKASGNTALMPAKVRAATVDWLRREADSLDQQATHLAAPLDQVLCNLASAVLRIAAGSVGGYAAAAKTRPVVLALAKLQSASTAPRVLESSVLSLDVGAEPLPNTAAARAIKARLERFISQIRPTQGHIEEANRQVNFLIDKLHDKVNSNGTLRLEKILRAGSNAKHTSLRRTADNVFDVDLGAYFSGSGAKKSELDALLSFTRDRLIEIYGDRKAKEDFEKLKSAVRITFHGGIRLQVDVAPIVSDSSLKMENGGWIPRPNDDWRLTSVTRHVDFTQERSRRAKVMPGPVKFNRLVRLIKWWNNSQGDARHPSIIIDLLTAAAFDARGVTPDWPTSVRSVFQFLRQHQLRTPVIFGDNYTPASVTPPFGDLVVLLDPVNKDNNVTRTWVEKDRTDFLRRVNSALDAIHRAHASIIDDDEDGAIEAWSEVFGPDFRWLSDPEGG